MTLQFWLLIKYRWGWWRAALIQQDLTWEPSRTFGQAAWFNQQHTDKMRQKSNKETPSLSCYLCTCMSGRGGGYHFFFSDHIHMNVRRTSRLKDCSRGMLHSVQGDGQLCLWRVDGDFPLPLSPLRQQMWPASCDQTVPSSLLSLGLISWKASAAGCPRFTDHLPPPIECIGCSLSVAEPYWHLLDKNGTATRKCKDALFSWFERTLGFWNKIRLPSRN